jgi:Cyclic nucleotide-binding domain
MYVREGKLLLPYPSAMQPVNGNPRSDFSSPPEAVCASLLFENWLRNLPVKIIDDFEAIQVETFYNQDATLFLEHQKASAIFIIDTGSVALSQSFGQKPGVNSRVAGPGEILGVPAALTGDLCYDTAQTLELSRVRSVHREDLLSFLCAHNAAPSGWSS